MGFRFRKILSFGKGFRINLSKGGISSSFGVPGATLNLGKNGARTTFGIPGTGFSYTSSQSKGGNKQLTSAIAAILVIVIVCLFCLCISIVLLVGSENPQQPTSTPAARNIPIDEIIAMTANAAQAQTLAAASPIPTSTLAPTMTLAPSFTPAPTSTIIIFVVPARTQSNNNNVCSCSSDSLNCKNFQTHAAALACFNSCMAQGKGDIHKLDENNDMNPCEGLP